MLMSCSLGHYSIEAGYSSARENFKTTWGDFNNLYLSKFLINAYKGQILFKSNIIF